ncbi:unnamed protein product, partial [Mesorhabditis spiculigera]
MASPLHNHRGAERSDGELSSGDDEPAVKCARVPAISEQQSSSGTKWRQLIVERELDRVGEVRLQENIVNRGSETFEPPPVQASSVAAPLIAVSPADDEDPFAGPPDLASIETFGFSKNEPRRKEDDRGFRRQPCYVAGRLMTERPPKNFRIKPKQPGAGDKVAKPVEQPAGRGRGGAARGHGPRGMPMRGGRGGRGGGPAGMSRPGQAMKRPHEQRYEQRRYTLEGLLEAEFDPALSIEDFSRQMAEALGEMNVELLTKLVTLAGKEKAYEVFDKTRQIEKGGGMKTADGSRQRTPGGIFIYLLKADESLPKEEVAAIFAPSLIEQRRIAKAKKRRRLNEAKAQAAMEVDGQQDDVKPPIEAETMAAE